MPAPTVKTLPLFVPSTIVVAGLAPFNVRLYGMLNFLGRWPRRSEWCRRTPQGRSHVRWWRRPWISSCSYCRRRRGPHRHTMFAGTSAREPDCKPFGSATICRFACICGIAGRSDRGLRSAAAGKQCCGDANAKRMGRPWNLHRFPSHAARTRQRLAVFGERGSVPA